MIAYEHHVRPFHRHHEPVGRGRQRTGPINFKTSQFGKTKAALARVAGGTGRGKLVCIGDSTTFGEGSGTGGNGRVGCMPKSWPAKLAASLTALGSCRERKQDRKLGHHDDDRHDYGKPQLSKARV